MAYKCELTCVPVALHYKEKYTMKLRDLLRILFSCTLTCSLMATICGCHQSVQQPTEPTQTKPSQTEPTETDPTAPKTQLRIMTFNVWFKNEESVTIKNTAETANVKVSGRLPRLLQMMETEQVDIAGLQEVGPAWIYNFNQTPPERYAFVGQYTKSTQEAGYILYNRERFSLLAHDYFWLAPGMPKEPVKGWDGDHDRMVNWTVFQEKETGIIFLFCDTHFDNGGAQARLESAKIVNSWIQEKILQLAQQYQVTQVPAFLVGDLNCQPGSQPYQELSLVMTDARKAAQGETLADSLTSSPGLTYLADGQALPENGHFIDHIFFLGPVTVHSTKMELTATNLCHYGPYLSDHNAVFADVTITNES